MEKFRKPRGVVEYLEEEYYQKSVIENEIYKTLFSFGFNRVETPSLEYFSLYSGLVSEEAASRMFKFIDCDGNLLALRPDLTVQVNRLAATKLKDGVQKLYYSGKAYELIPDTNGQTQRDREFLQIGSEILGCGEVSCDVEILTLAIACLLASGLIEFVIEVGSESIFLELAIEAKLSLDETEKIREFVCKKDITSLGGFLEAKRIDCPLLLNLPLLYGRAEVLEKAKKLTKNKSILETLKRLEKIYSVLQNNCLEQYISLDIGLLKGSYYTGLVFRGLSKNCGSSILEGGRYDNLGKALGFDRPAVGFAIGVKRLFDILQQEGKVKNLPPIDIGYIGDNFAIVKKLRSENKRVLQVSAKNANELKEYCRKNNIKRAMVISKNSYEEYNL